MTWSYIFVRTCVPGFVVFLFERSEFLIDTPKKKSVRPSVCSTNLGFSVGYATNLGFSVGYVLCTYVPGISRQKSHHVRSRAWLYIYMNHVYTFLVRISTFSFWFSVWWDIPTSAFFSLLPDTDVQQLVRIPTFSSWFSVCWHIPTSAFFHLPDTYVQHLPLYY